MAFEINTDTSAITMHRGDTGAYYVTLTQEDGGSFVDGDLAIYEVKQGENVLIYREFNLQPAEPNDYECGNGKFLIAFNHSVTDSWAAGTYNTEIRVIYNPIRSAQAAVVPKIYSTYYREGLIYPTVDVDTCIAELKQYPMIYGETGSKIFEYGRNGWYPALEPFGISCAGTPINDDEIVLYWDFGNSNQIIDGSMVRTITKSKSTITILDTLIDI